MEFICPVCGQWTEIREHQAFAGTRLSCPRGSRLRRMTTDYALRVACFRDLLKMPVGAKHRVSHKKTWDGRDHRPAMW